MFDGLRKGLAAALKTLRGKGRLSEANIREAMLSTAQLMPTQPRARQGAGLLRPRLAVEWAERRLKGAGSARD